MVINEMTTLLSGLCSIVISLITNGLQSGAEAAVHANRNFLNKLEFSFTVVELNFKNGFNYIRRDQMLQTVRDLAP